MQSARKRCLVWSALVLGGSYLAGLGLVSFACLRSRALGSVGLQGIGLLEQIVVRSTFLPFILAGGPFTLAVPVASLGVLLVVAGFAWRKCWWLCLVGDAVLGLIWIGLVWFSAGAPLD